MGDSNPASCPTHGEEGILKKVQPGKWVDPGASTALCWLSIDSEKGSRARASCSLPPYLYSEGIAPFLRFDNPLPGQLYVVGGRNQQQDPLDVVEMFDTWHGEWVTCPSMSAKRAGCAAAALPDGRLLVVGGYDEKGIVEGLLESCEVFDPRTKSWALFPAPLGRPRWGHGCATLQGRVFAVGGCSLRPGAPPHEAFMETLRSCEVHDPAKGTWTVSADLHVARAGARVVTLGERYLAAVGGCDDVFGRAELLASLEIFDVDVGSWVLLGGQLSTPRTTAAVAAIDGQRILIVGGAPSLSSAEVYNVPPPEQENGSEPSVGEDTENEPSADNEFIPSAILEIGAQAQSQCPGLSLGQPRFSGVPSPGATQGDASGSNTGSRNNGRAGARLVRDMPEGRMGCQAAAMNLPSPGQNYPLCTRQCVIVVGGETGDEDWDAHIRQFSSILVYDVEDDDWRSEKDFPPIPTPRTAMALCVAPGAVTGHP